MFPWTRIITVSIAFPPPAGTDADGWWVTISGKLLTERGERHTKPRPSAVGKGIAWNPSTVGIGHGRLRAWSKDAT